MFELFNGSTEAKPVWHWCLFPHTFTSQHLLKDPSSPLFAGFSSWLSPSSPCTLSTCCWRQPMKEVSVRQCCMEYFSGLFLNGFPRPVLIFHFFFKRCTRVRAAGLQSLRVARETCRLLLYNHAEHWRWEHSKKCCVTISELLLYLHSVSKLKGWGKKQKKRVLGRQNQLVFQECWVTSSTNFSHSISMCQTFFSLSMESDNHCVCCGVP